MNHVVILAAGKGTRMKSDLPKVLNPVKGIPIINRLLTSVTEVCPKPTIIVGYKASEVIKATGNQYHYVEQKEQLGTGHAMMMARDALKDKGYKNIVVLLGDHPLVSVATINKLIENHTKSDAVVTLGTVRVEKNDPRLLIFNNFGRVIRNKHGDVDRIVEFKDATADERDIREFNLSYYCFDAEWLWNNLDKLKNTNASKEYYLTDMAQIAKKQGRHVGSYIIKNIPECLGINTVEQLHMVEEALESYKPAKSSIQKQTKMVS